MHVVFSRVRRKSQILADLADSTDFGVFLRQMFLAGSWVSTLFQPNLRWILGVTLYSEQGCNTRKEM